MYYEQPSLPPTTNNFISSTTMTIQVPRQQPRAEQQQEPTFGVKEIDCSASSSPPTPFPGDGGILIVDSVPSSPPRGSALCRKKRLVGSGGGKGRKGGGAIVLPPWMMIGGTTTKNNDDDEEEEDDTLSTSSLTSYGDTVTSNSSSSSSRSLTVGGTTTQKTTKKDVVMGVRFAPVPVTDVWTRERTPREEVSKLYYSCEETNRFRREYHSEQRRLEQQRCQTNDLLPDGWGVDDGDLWDRHDNNNNKRVFGGGSSSSSFSYRAISKVVVSLNGKFETFLADCADHDNNYHNDNNNNDNMNHHHHYPSENGCPFDNDVFWNGDLTWYDR